MTATLEQLLETLVRPALRTHNGDVELVSYQDGILRLRMLGQCAGCPAAAMTNETLIEGQLMPLLPDLKDVKTPLLCSFFSGYGAVANKLNEIAAQKN